MAPDHPNQESDVCSARWRDRENVLVYRESGDVQDERMAWREHGRILLGLLPKSHAVQGILFELRSPDNSLLFLPLSARLLFDTGCYAKRLVPILRPASSLAGVPQPRR